MSVPDAGAGVYHNTMEVHRWAVKMTVGTAVAFNGPRPGDGARRPAPPGRIFSGFQGPASVLKWSGLFGQFEGFANANLTKLISDWLRWIP